MKYEDRRGFVKLMSFFFMTSLLSPEEEDTYGNCDDDDDDDEMMRTTGRRRRWAYNLSVFEPKTTSKSWKKRERNG